MYLPGLGCGGGQAESKDLPLQNKTDRQTDRQTMFIYIYMYMYMLCV